MTVTLGYVVEQTGLEPAILGYEPSVIPFHYRSEPHAGFEPASPVWKTGMLPLHQWGIVTWSAVRFIFGRVVRVPQPSQVVKLPRIELGLPGPKPGGLPLHHSKSYSRRVTNLVRVCLFKNYDDTVIDGCQSMRYVA